MSDEKKDEAHATSRAFSWSRLVFFFFFLLLIAAGAGAGYFQYIAVNQPLTQKMADLTQQAESDRATITALQQSVAVLEQAAQKTESLSEQQARVMAEWQAAQKGNLEKWSVAEAQYLVKLADEQVQYAHNLVSALILLQRADQVLQQVQDVRLDEIRKSLAGDVARLQAAPQVDITALYMHLTELAPQIDQLVLPASPLKSVPKADVPAVSPDEVWWKRGLAHSWQALKQLVVIKYNGANTLPLVMPEERAFLYQNLHMQLECAKWAVLNRNAAVYQTSLTQAMKWIDQYFVTNTPVTQNVLQRMDNLRRVNIQPQPMNLSATLQLFNSYLSASAAPAAVS